MFLIVVINISLRNQKIIRMMIAVAAIKEVVLMTDQEVVKRATDFARSYKGQPYSESEFNEHLYYALESLVKAGATDEQIKLFNKTVNNLPLKGGSFNSYSGD